MMYIENKIKGATVRLVAALEQVEQAVQAARWRVTNAPLDVTSLGEEVGALCGESAQAARLFGELAVVISLENVGQGCRCAACGTGMVRRCEACSGEFCPDCVQEQGGRSLCAGCHYGEGAAVVPAAAGVASGSQVEDNTPSVTSVTSVPPTAVADIPDTSDPQPPSQVRHGRYTLVKGEGAWFDLHISTPDGVRVVECYDTTHEFGQPKSHNTVLYGLKNSLKQPWGKKAIRQALASAA